MPHAVVVGARNLGGSVIECLLADGWDVSAIAQSDETVSAARDRGCAAHQADAMEPAQLRAAHELRDQGIHVALLVVDGPIASPKTAAMLAGVPADATVAQDDVALAVAQLATQPMRGRTHELTLTPAGRPPAPW
jgi:uncharacterized protein YbjT (DUF2867 family)